MNKLRGDNKKGNLGRVVRRPLWILLVGYAIRAGHQVGAAVFLCSYLLPELTSIPQFFLWLTLITGGLLFFTELFRHRELYREVAGIVTFSKLLLFGAAFHSILSASETVMFAFLLASVGAHLPKNIRHKLLF